MKSNATTTQSAPVPVSLASFWRKFAAWIYDLLGAFAVFILSLAIGYTILSLFSFIWVEAGQETNNSLNSSPLATSLSNSPLWSLYIAASVQYYYVWCWVKGGQTVGMRTWRLKLCKPDGRLLTWKEAYLRSLLSFAGIAQLWGLFDRESRGWHDLACNSRVIVLPKGHDKPTEPLI